MPDIRHLITIDRPAAEVFALVSTGTGLAQWWAEDVFDATTNKVSLGFFNRTTVYTLRFAEMTSPTLAMWECESGAEWQGTRIVFDLGQPGKTTSLKFSHEGWHAETDYFRSCNTTWGGLMFRLKGAAEGKSLGPLFRAQTLAY